MPRLHHIKGHYTHSCHLPAGKTWSTGTTTYCRYQVLWRWCGHCSICHHGLSDLQLPWPFRKRPFFASVRGPEEYEFLKACFEPVWRELQELIQHPFLCINGTQIQLDIVFGSDLYCCQMGYKCTRESVQQTTPRGKAKNSGISASELHFLPSRQTPWQ
jgi:hypothetical protein